MPSAKTQRLEEIRAERNTKLDASDKEMAKATETNTKEQDWKTYRQALRDLPATVNMESVTTAAELAAFVPMWPTAPDEKEHPA
jgi:hypothetical protein